MMNQGIIHLACPHFLQIHPNLLKLALMLAIASHTPLDVFFIVLVKDLSHMPDIVEANH